MHTQAPLLKEHRPGYPEVVAFSVPRGGRHRLQSFAADAGMSVSELIRRAVARFVSEPAGEPRTSVEA